VLVGEATGREEGGEAEPVELLVPHPAARVATAKRTATVAFMKPPDPKAKR
jgi:hypothetical protein